MTIALVTGTSTGIGLATAITLGRAGHTVFAGMRNLDGAAELRSIAEREKLAVGAIQLDVTDDASVARAIDHVLAVSGRIDVLVNNAGIGGRGPVKDAAIDDYRRIMETNLYGVLRCIQAVLPGMCARRAGTVINVSSLSGRIALSPQAPYAASKWALEGVSECLAHEMRAFNVRVAIIEPGVTATPIFGKGTPPLNPDDPQTRRLTALFKTLRPTATSPYVVAEQIRAIVEGDSWQLRYPTGLDAPVFLNWRAGKSDEEWVALGGVGDAEWSAEIKRQFGLDVTP